MTQTKLGITESLEILGLKPIAQKVFIYLSEHGTSPVTDIAFKLNIPKSSIYDALTELTGQSLIVEYSENKNKTFSVINNDGLEKIISQKIEKLKTAGSALLHFNSMKKHSGRGSKPRIKFYFGDEGIRQAFRDTMWNKNCTETYLMWPTIDMVESLTPEFAAWHSDQRMRYKVFLYVIRKYSDKLMDVEYMKDTPMSKMMKSPGWSSFHEIRTAPKDFNWDMSFWVYDNKCLCASSGQDKFAFVVHSKEFADLMILLWKQVWNISK